MNIRNIDNQKFGAIVPENKKVEEILFERLKTPKRYIQYKDIVKSQDWMYLSLKVKIKDWKQLFVLQTDFL